MKHLILLLSTVLLLNSCSKNDLAEVDDTHIIGTWQLIEVFSSDGSNNPQWHSIKDGYTYSFNNDGTFNSNRFNECLNGNFEITDGRLILQYDCENFTTGIESPKGTFIEDFSITNNEMTLKPTYLLCIEGCGYKFIKIK